MSHRPHKAKKKRKKKSALEKRISDIATPGTCFKDAYDLMFSMPEEIRSKARLCHGMVNGTGPVEGLRFPHAWVEMDDVVFDVLNGKTVSIHKRTYYQAGVISDDELVSYTYEQVVGLFNKNGYHGIYDDALDKVIDLKTKEQIQAPVWN